MRGRARPSSAEVLLAALDVVEVALRSCSRDEAAVAARDAVAQLDGETARRVAVALAVECTLTFRAPRGVSLQAWLERRRLAARRAVEAEEDAPPAVAELGVFRLRRERAAGRGKGSGGGRRG